MKILVTGGAGYIGSTICSALEDHHHTPLVIDSLVTGKEEFTHGRPFYHADISDIDALKTIFEDHDDIEAIVHCAGRITIPESVINPFIYYKENLSKSIDLFNFLSETRAKRIVFSSTAGIYENKNGEMVTEGSTIRPGNPYANTKLAIEMALHDFCLAYSMSSISLRYFNPIGADPKMRSGPYTDNPTHILGKLINAARNKTAFEITGADWPTRDGTGIRDYVHVWDLAEAHVKAIERFDNVVSQEQPFLAINLGTGQGFTVLEFLELFEEVLGEKLIRLIAPSRDGDSAGSFASLEKARTLLSWEPRMSLEQGIADAIKWSRKHTTH